MSNFTKMCELLESKELNISTIAENTKLSPAYIQKNAFMPIDGQIYVAGKVNADALLAAFTKKKIDDSMLDIEMWTLPERKASRSDIDFQVGKLYTMPKNNGKQSMECVYRCEWHNDDYVLLVPFRGFAMDSTGANRTPRAMGKGVAQNNGCTEIEPDATA